MEVNQSIRDDFTCIVCLEIMLPPIKMCILGHSVCNNCYKQITWCPICRSPKGHAHNYALEGLLEKVIFPCKFQNKGCVFKANGVTITEHETTCDYSFSECLLKNAFDCKWYGPFKHNFNHCLIEHSQNSFTSDRVELKTDKSYDNSEYEYWFIVQCGALFRCKWTVNFETSDARLWIYCYASTEKQKKLIYKYHTIKLNQDEAQGCFMVQPSKPYVENMYVSPTKQLENEEEEKESNRALKVLLSSILVVSRWLNNAEEAFGLAREIWSSLRDVMPRD